MNPSGISVRKLAEFTARHGDLYPVRQGRQVDAEEGIDAQKRVQQQRLTEIPGYQCEVSVELGVQWQGADLSLRGRIDGLCVTDHHAKVEEYKCVGALPDQANSVDYAQALIYAGMLAHQHPHIETFHVEVVYLEVEGLAQRNFSHPFKREALLGVLDFLLLCYCVRLQRHLDRNQQRLDWLPSLNFPMPTYRGAQHAIARRVYQCVLKRENLLLEAPTGSGKSLGVLFPSIRAQALQEQIFFLTSRNPGAQAALATVKQIDPDAQMLNVVEIKAKEKVCLVPGTPCDASQCEYARGYYDKVGEAIELLLQLRFADTEVIDRVARQFHVCPFELSLDYAIWVDIIIGDYNYVLDPVVRLQRFRDHDGLHLLIDEAHQLSPRVREMLAVEVDRDMVQQAKGVGHSGLEKRIASVDRALLTLRRKVAGKAARNAAAECQIEMPDPLERACKRLTEFVAEQDIQIEQYPDVVPLFFAASRWLRSQSWYDSETFAHLLSWDRKRVKLRRVCLDPARYIQEVCNEHGAVVRFSGTLSPMLVYQRLHGQDQGASERAPSPFSPEQVKALVVPDIPTYFAQRERSLANLVQFIVNIVQLEPGQYLIALPSYQYLRQVGNALQGALSSTECAVFQQQPGQDAETLLDTFYASNYGLCAIVMGGVLGESVDFSGAQLKGVFLVGLGLPPPSEERKAIQAHFEAHQGEGWGRLVAYTQPALVKNVQAAGRLIRSETDFGVICLIDPRFASNEVQRFFPNHWQPSIANSMDAVQAVNTFWQSKRAQEDSAEL